MDLEIFKPSEAATTVALFASERALSSVNPAMRFINEMEDWTDF